MVPFSITLIDPWPWFQGRDIFDVEYLRNDTRYSHSYYRTSIGSRMRSIEWWHWRTLTRFSMSQHFWSRISPKRTKFL